MAFNVGQIVVYKSPKGKEFTVTVLKRKIDYKGGFIDEPNYKGNFDYFVSYEGKNGLESTFCSEDQLREI